MCEQFSPAISNQDFSVAMPQTSKSMTNKIILKYHAKVEKYSKVILDVKTVYSRGKETMLKETNLKPEWVDRSWVH